MKENKTLQPFYLDLTESEIVEITEIFKEILRTGQLILGKYTAQFEREFADYIGSKYAVALNSCTSALEILLRLNKCSGNQFAVQSNTNFASVAAIIHAGGYPVFMDMDSNSFSPNLNILKRTLERNKSITGVVWVHIGGIICQDFPNVVEYCLKNNIVLIEDCAHAHGSMINSVYAGNWANGGAFSFFPTKVMTTMEGGMITTNNEEHYKLAKSFRNQGKRDGNYGGLHYDLGNSWRISEIAAYIGILQLSKLNEMIKKRQRAVTIISKSLNQANIEYISSDHMNKASNYKFIIKLKPHHNIKSIKEQLKKEGINCGGGVYEIPCHLHPVFKDINYDKENLITTELFCPNHICPPITSGTTDEDSNLMAEALCKILR